MSLQSFRVFIQKRKKVLGTILALCALAVIILWANNALPYRNFYYQGPSRNVTVFYGNSELDPELNCDRVFPVVRNIRGWGNEAVLQTLFDGPTEEEEQAGYFMSNNSEVDVEKINVRGEVAYVDFDEALIKDVAGSCRVIAIRTEIEETLKHLLNVKNVVISVNGETEGILEP